MAAERILVVGGPGTGKTTLAERIGRATGAPVTRLDDIARVGGGRGAERSDAERTTDVENIVASKRWIAEGVHLGWTRPLLAAADVIVWLDHVPPRTSSARIVRRFVGQALREARRRRGRERFLRLGDYARRLRELVVSVPETRSFPRAELERELSRYAGKVVRCRTAADVERAFEQLSGRSAPDRGHVAADQ